MYPEFVPIYIGLGVIAVLNLIMIVLLIVVLKKQGKPRPKNYYAAQQPQWTPQFSGGAAPSAQSGGVAFCKTCGMQFDANLRICPRCGASR